MKKIYSEEVPPPGGHYSQAIVHNETIYVSGILPVSLGNPPDPLMPFREQVLLVLKNLAAILREAGSSPVKVIKVSVFVSDIDNWPEVNEVYKSFFGDHKPARIVVPVKELHFGFGIELDAIAAV
jgi:2-iminobutanoate/2-iminopropanoate deaminase